MAGYYMTYDHHSERGNWHECDADDLADAQAEADRDCPGTRLTDGRLLIGVPNGIGGFEPIAERPLRADAWRDVS